MSSSVEGSSSADMLPRTPHTESSGRVSAWRLTRRNGSPRRWSSRLNLLTLGIVSLSLLTAMITWATTSIGPAPHVAITLASTDYCANLDLPPNGYGNRAVGRLASWVTLGKRSASRNIGLNSTPINLSTKAAFDQIDWNPDAAVSITFLSAHGISTPDGAALLPADAEGIEDAFLIRALLDRIAALPADQQKVLLLDCAHFTANASFGILLNDFARQLRELDPVIKEIPNLVVLASAGVNEQSWIDPSSGTTAWSDALIKALNGEASDLDNDGWIDLIEVHQTAAQLTRQWVGRVCQQDQSAFMLPLGNEAVSRSKSLGLYPTRTRSIAIPRLAASVRKDRIEFWSTKHSVLAARALSPVITHPVAWRRFEQTLLRFEHFELAGCRNAADTLQSKLEDLAVTLQAPTRIESVACHAGVLSPETVGFVGSKKLDAIAEQLSTLLSEKPISEAVDQWLSVAADQPDAASIAYLRRAIIENKVRRIADALRDEAEVDRKRLSRGASLVQAITDPLQPLPQVGQVLQLLARDLPETPLGSEDATNIARFLELTNRSDRASSGAMWWAPKECRWIREWVQRADQSRRFAGDLLLGDSDARARAAHYLAESEAQYKQADEIASGIRNSAIISKRGAHDLRWVSQLLSVRTVYALDDSFERESEAIDSLYRNIDRIDAILVQDPPVDPIAKTAILNELDGLTNSYQERFQVIHEKSAQWQVSVLQQEAAAAPDVFAALGAVGGSSKQRLTAWTKLVRIAGTSASQDASALSKENRPVSQIKAGASIRGVLALSPWSSNAFDNLIDGQRESRQQVEHRLHVFAAESKWWDSLQQASQQIAAREVAARRLSEIEPTEETRASGKYSQLLRMSPVPAYECQQFVTRQHSKSLSHYLAWQASRFTADGYWSMRQEGPAYFARVTELIDSDLASFSSDDANADANSARTCEVHVRSPNEIVWTTQQEEQLNVGIVPTLKGRQGYATIWLETTGNVRPISPLPGVRVCRPLSQQAAASNPVDPANADGLLVQLIRDDQPPSQRNNVAVHGYFRGRALHHNIRVRIAETPDVHIIENPVPRGGRVAVRTSGRNRVASSGAITLVLDCSGSMGAARGESFGEDTKYAQAIKAVDTLLADLPTGVKLSVWTFGQAVGDQKTASPAERSIRRVQAPIVWDARDPSMRENLIEAISYPNLEPWNESPLLAALIAASDDLKRIEGVRSMVVITDGADNRVSTDAVTNPLGLSPEKLLKKHFDASGITVNVIAFRVADGEESATRNQLQTVEHLIPAGRFVEAQRTSELSEALSQMLSVTKPITIRKVARGGSNENEIAAALATSPAEAAPTWTSTLQPGLYAADSADQSAGALIELQDGDQLVLEQSPTGRLRIWPEVDHQYGWCPRRQSGRWTMALVPDPSTTDDMLRRRLVLSGTVSGGALAIDRPGELWIEATQNDNTLPIRWAANHRVAGLARELSVPRAAGVGPDVKVWLSDRQASPSGVLIRDRDFLHLADLAPARWHVSDGVIHLLSARVETHRLADATGDVTEQPCLVLRGSCPPGSYFRLRTVGLSFDGYDEQFFGTLGQFTLRQWPVTQSDAERTLKRVELISVEQFKTDAERGGGKVIFSDEQPRKLESAAVNHVSGRSL